jgi:DNA-binding transcriptional ArsR family regulator
VDHPLVELDASPPYEVLLGLASASRRGPSGADATHGASTDLLDLLHRFSAGSDKVFPHLIALARECPAPRTVESFLVYLDGIEAEHIFLHLLGYHMRYFRSATPAAVIRAAADGDASARDTFLATSYPDDAPWQAALRTLLSSGPTATKSLVLRLVSGWYEEVFEEQEATVMQILRRDIDLRRLQLSSLSSEDVIELATNGIEYVPESGIGRVLLIPSFACRPWVHTVDSGDLKIFCYPVADESVVADGTAPPPRLLAVAKALGDERRLHVLKLLSGGRYSLPEIAQYFGVPKTTMLHHLMILRSAGLVRVRSSDRKYALHLATMPDVSDLLNAYLKGDTL